MAANSISDFRMPHHLPCRLELYCRSGSGIHGQEPRKFQSADAVDVGLDGCLRSGIFPVPRQSLRYCTAIYLSVHSPSATVQRSARPWESHRKTVLCLLSPPSCRLRHSADRAVGFLIFHDYSKERKQTLPLLFSDFTAPAAAGFAATAVLEFRTVPAISAGRLLFLVFVGRQIRQQDQSNQNNNRNQKVIHKIPPYFSQLQPEQQPPHFPPSGQPMHVTPFFFAL